MRLYLQKQGPLIGSSADLRVIRNGHRYGQIMVIVTQLISWFEDHGVRRRVVGRYGVVSLLIWSSVTRNKPCGMLAYLVWGGQGKSLPRIVQWRSMLKSLIF